MGSIIPAKMFLTKGVGFHKYKLRSFEEALKKAGIEQFNLSYVSSIFPPRCKILSKEKGLKYLEAGQIVYCVMARSETDEARRLVSASIGLAIPKEKNMYGYLSEHHAFGEKEQQSGDFAEDLAAEMLATTLGIDFDSEASWDQKKEIWKISNKIVRTCNVTQASICPKNGTWTTVIAAAVFIC